MSDLVERLRTDHFFSDSVMAARMEEDELAIDTMRSERKEAAARIEQLEASLAEWKALAIQWAKDHDQLCEDEGCPNAGTPHVCINRQEKRKLPLAFSYKNYRGEVATRIVTPISVRFGSTEWHPEPQWLLLAFDHEKRAEREFAMTDMSSPRQENDDVFKGFRGNNEA